MTREQKLNLIYRSTHRDYKGKIDGVRTIMVYRNGTTLIDLESLTDAEIESKLPKAAKQTEAA